MRKRLVIASHNKGKVAEFRTLFAAMALEVLPLSDFTDSAPEETGSSFSENASIKAEAALKATGEASLADDSGLCVTHLHGAPGIFSARWAGPQADFTLAATRIRQALFELGHDSSPAQFVCALALHTQDGLVRCVSGRVTGKLVFPPRGRYGFGFDPIFVPTGHSKSFGEMSAAEKTPLTHRSAALTRMMPHLRAWLADQYI